MKVIILFFSFIFCLSCNKNANDKEEVVLHIDKQMSKFERLELEVLKKGNSKKIFVYDLVDNKDCNKSKIQYLGIVEISNDFRLKVLTSFFVNGDKNNCHGASAIKLYDLENNFYGQYSVGMPDDLPDAIKGNDLIFLKDNDECDQRKNYVIKLEKKLPEEIFIPCTKNGGDLYPLDIKK